jgi:hypothetical protein
MGNRAKELHEHRRTLSRIATTLREVAKTADPGKAAAELREVETAIHFINRAFHAAEAGEVEGTPAGSLTKGRPVRALVLDALEDLGWPAYTREIALYCQARYGRVLSPTRFGTLASDEVKSYVKGKRPQTVWLCFGLTSTRGEAIRRLWARSDWPLDRRIVAPTTGRIQHLRLTARLCEIAMEAEDTAADPGMLRIIAADHARDLPGLKFRRGEFPLEQWRDLAVDLLSKAEGIDADARREGARRFHHVPELQQLFGAVEPVEGVDRIRPLRENPR